MMFSFESRTRELLRAVWVHGSVSAAAAELGMDASNATRHLRTAERRAGTRLVERRPGGRGGPNAHVTAAGRRVLNLRSQIAFALPYDDAQGATPLRIGSRLLFAAGRIPPGPADIYIRPEAVALERPAKRPPVSSVRNRFPARVDAIEPEAQGIFRVFLSAGALRLESRVVRGAVKDLRLRTGSRVYANIKAVSIAASSRPVRA